MTPAPLGVPRTRGLQRRQQPVRLVRRHYAKGKPLPVDRGPRNLGPRPTARPPQRALDGLRSWLSRKAATRG